MATLQVLVVGDRELSERLGADAGTPRFRVLGPFPPSVASAAGLAPDVIVVDLHAGGLPTVVDLVARFPTARILVAGAEDADASMALAAGAAGVFPGPGGDAAAAVRRVAAGHLVVDRNPSVRPDAGRLDGLTAREREVLRLVAEGCTTVEIARVLGIAPTTVHRHVGSALAKLGVRSKVEAAKVAWRTGLAAMPAPV
jgi:DNA-binding NarL/FixJ family response regulator